MRATGPGEAGVDNSSASTFIDYLSFRRLPGQLPELDGLRGIAVLLVLLRHAVRPFWSDEAPVANVFGWDLGTLMINGWVGVDLFFVLSGFLITYHIIRLRARLGGNWNWKPYLAKRALRIIPAYYAVIFITVLGVFPYYEFPSQVLGLRVTYHMLFLQDYLPANIVVAFWSLGVEEKFYLIAPFLILIGANRKTFAGRIAGICVLFSLGLALRIYTALTDPTVETYLDFFHTFRSPFHMTMDPILIGVLIALIYDSRAELPRVTSRIGANVAFWLGMGVFIGFATTGAMMDKISLWDKTLQPTLIALAFGLITHGLIFGGGPARFFRSTLLFFFGRISYCLYLVHLPLVPLSLSLAEQIAPEMHFFVLFLPIFIVLSLFSALVLHYAVEKPFLRLKDRIT